MTQHPPCPPVADQAPESASVTAYDEQHFASYVRLLLAEAEGAEWREVARLVLHLDPAGDEVKAHRAWASHLARAQWMFGLPARATGLEPHKLRIRLPLQPPVADAAPTSERVTRYDWHHCVTYWRLLDAEADKADWREVAKIVLHLDPKHDENRARRAWESHLARAHWMTQSGYRQSWRLDISDER